MAPIRTSFLIAATAALVTACGSTPTAQGPTPSAPTQSAGAESGPAPRNDAQTAPASAPVAAASLPPYVDPSNPLSTQKSVYLDFDRSNIEPQYMIAIERQGNYLATARKIAIRIEANCDERGGRGYNLGLGQRRADAVASRLRMLGASAAQIETVSYGKEKPLALGHDETAWAENRRADIVYPTR